MNRREFLMSSACAGLATATAKIDPLFAEDAPAPARLYRCGTPPPTPAAKIQAMLAPDQGSQAYQDYLAGNDCRVLVKLNEGAVDALLAEAAQSTPPSAMEALRQVTRAALAQIDRIERSALEPGPDVDAGGLLLLRLRRDHVAAPAGAAANHHACGFRTNRPMQGRRPDGIGVNSASRRLEELKLGWLSLGRCRR